MYKIMYEKQTKRILNVGQRPWANEEELKAKYGEENIIVTEYIEEKYPDNLGNYFISEVGKIDLKNKKIVVDDNLKQTIDDKIEVKRLIDERKTEEIKEELISEGILDMNGSLVK